MGKLLALIVLLVLSVMTFLVAKNEPDWDYPYLTKIGMYVVSIVCGISALILLTQIFTD